MHGPNALQPYHRRTAACLVCGATLLFYVCAEVKVSCGTLGGVALAECVTLGYPGSNFFSSFSYIFCLSNFNKKLSDEPTHGNFQFGIAMQ